MSCGFLRLPAELRNSIYELLIPPEPVKVGQRDWDGCRSCWPGYGLLLASRLIHEETSAVFYGQSLFNFQGCVSEREAPTHGNCWHLEPFFNQIGRNAAQIRTIRITFPKTDSQDGQMVISRDSTDALAVLVEHCVNVRTIHTTLCRTRYESEDPDHYAYRPSKADLDALTRINNVFRGFKALEQIIVEHYHNTGRQDELLRRIATFGWTMVGIEHPEWGELIFCSGPIDSDNED